MPKSTVLSSVRETVNRLVRAQERPTITRVAEALRMSPRSLQRYLNEAGVTHREIVLRSRLDLARRMLADTNKSVQEIGAAMNYSDASHFSRFFARMTGISPSTYRRRCRTGGAGGTDCIEKEEWK